MRMWYRISSLEWVGPVELLDTTPAAVRLALGRVGLRVANVREIPSAHRSAAIAVASETSPDEPVQFFAGVVRGDGRRVESLSGSSRKTMVIQVDDRLDRWLCDTATLRRCSRSELARRILLAGMTSGQFEPKE